MQIGFPLDLDSHGRTAEATEDAHIRDLIEQVLFTSPGERVNRPDFGSGLLRMTFAPIGDALSTALQLEVQAALQQWLGDLILVQAIEVEPEDSLVRVSVQYVIQRSQRQQVARFVKREG